MCEVLPARAPFRFPTARRIVCAAWLLPCVALGCADATVVQEPHPIEVSAAAATLVSDGTTSTIVQALIPPSLPQDATVEFTTTTGRFVNPAGAPERKISVRARGGRAEARLIPAGETGTAHVSATGAGSTDFTTVEITPAMPDEIDLFLDRTEAPANGTTAVTATAVLRRRTGTVSRGVPVRFEVRDSASEAVHPEMGGVVAADSVGSATIKLTTTRPGTVDVRAIVDSQRSAARRVRFTLPGAATATAGKP